MLISLDTELTGLDLYHEARPFIVTVCQDDGTQLLWEWDVCPLTRSVTIPQADIEELRQVVAEADEIVGQNLKIDVEALSVADIIPMEEWPWNKCHDTLAAGHLLASALPHDLTSMVLHYLGLDIKPYEDALREAVMSARRTVTSKKFNLEQDTDDLFGTESQRWRIAKQGDPSLPSAGSDAWHFDYWLPRTLAAYLGYEEIHDWYTVCSKYACVDSSHTLLLWKKMRQELEEKKLWAIYKESMRLPSVIGGMQQHGVTYNMQEGKHLAANYEQESVEFGDKCVAIAKSLSYDLELPKGATNHSLKWFAFGYDECTCRDCGCQFMDSPGGLHECAMKKCKSTDLEVHKRPGLDLPVIGVTETGPSLNKEAFDTWLVTLDEGPQLEFVRSLAGKRKCDTAVTYLDGYERYGVQNGRMGVVTLHPNLNQTGTAHLRMSSNNPNSQNVSKQTRDCAICKGTGEVVGATCVACKGQGEVNYNLRRPFVPAPGREFWALDYENIELRIPAYVAGERLMIELFEKPNEPPYWGSQHYLNSSVVYPELFWPLKDIPPNQSGSFKKKYASTEYQWMKNFDFALAYQCGEAQGDRTARRRGAWRRVKSTFKELDRLANEKITLARKHGVIETLPDKTVDPSRGYPLMTSRSTWGDVSPTIPLNYFVSGTAMWCTRKAMVRCQTQLDAWNQMVLIRAGLQDATVLTRRKHLLQYGYHIALQVHDELLFDFPAGGRRNLARAHTLKRLMEQSGDDIGVPLRVAISWHPKTWAESEDLEVAA